MTEYEVDIRQEAPVAVLSLREDIDRDAASALSAAYEAATAHNPSSLLLDFSNVRYINSTGIALIVQLLGRARSESRKVLAAGLSDHYAHIFSITRLSDFISIYDDVNSAVIDVSANQGSEK